MMQQKPCIPLSILKELRCKVCDKFVSCSPVHILPDETILCGRCKFVAKNIYRNYSYEALASMFLYPCYNWEKHCSRSLEWNECLEHESNCAYSSCCSRFWRRGVCCRGRREIPLGDIRLSQVPEQLLDEIKCVSCELYLSCEPVFIQTNGKNVCHRCIYGNGPPPNSIRNLAYEMLSNIVIFPCVYRNRGCPTRLKFGRDLWQHESECSYNRVYKKAPRNPSQKEKGVIPTHSGHYYGTITQNSVLFAPPRPNSDLDMNKEILKSLKKHQERKLVSADQIESQFVEKYSEDGSIDTDCSSSDKKNSYDAKSSGTDSPSRVDEDSRLKYYIYPNSNCNIEKRDSGYVSGSSNRNYNQNLITAQVHQENNKNSRPPSVQRQHSYTPQSYNPVQIPQPDYSDYYNDNANNFYNNVDEGMLAGHLPVFRNADVKGLAYQPSFKLVTRSDSSLSNRELINELKIKQKIRRESSMRQDFDSPYKKCNNLEDVMSVHDNIAK